MLFLKLKGKTGIFKNGGEKERKKMTALLLVFLEIFHLFYMSNVQSEAWTKGKVILTLSVRLHHCLENRPEFLPRKPALGFINSPQIQIMMKFLHGLN